VFETVTNGLPVTATASTLIEAPLMLIPPAMATLRFPLASAVVGSQPPVIGPDEVLMTKESDQR
jgi:hypothetical protein